LVNHFIPFTEAEVGAPDRFRVRLHGAVPGRQDRCLPRRTGGSGRRAATLWQARISPRTDVRTVRDELKLNRPDVGWYQIRNALKARNASGDTAPVNFGPFEAPTKR
jgi:hypothetical protein